MIKPVNIKFKYLFCQILIKIWKKSDEYYFEEMI